MVPVVDLPTWWCQEARFGERAKTEQQATASVGIDVRLRWYRWWTGQWTMVPVCHRWTWWNGGGDGLSNGVRGGRGGAKCSSKIRRT